MKNQLIFLDDSDLSNRIKKELGNDRYIFYHKNDYLVKNKHFDMYKDVFDKCERENISKVIFPQDISDIDILYNEVIKRKIKIVFRVPFREVIRTKIREKSFINLLNLEQVERCLIFNVEYKDEFNKYKKCVYLVDPVNEKKEWYDIKRNNHFFTVLFFGRIIKTKGIDIFNKSAEYNNLRNLVVGSSKYYEGNLSLYNVEYRDEYLKDEEIPSLFINSDIVVMPYEKFYEGGSSGILPQACFAKKPVIVSNIYPFNNLVKKYKLGYVLKTYSPKGLSNCITKLYSNYDKVKNKANFNGYINSLNTWKEISNYF